MTTAASSIPHAARFLTIRWTRVCLAEFGSEVGRKALADLCDAYDEPVVSYRHSVFRDADAAREMSRAFFEVMRGAALVAIWKALAS